jgi:hypothetical protein
MAVMITFTVSKYSTARFATAKLPFGCSLNVQEVIVLAEPNSDDNYVSEFTHPSTVGLDFGRYPPLSQYQAAAPTPNETDVKKLNQLQKSPVSQEKRKNSNEKTKEHLARLKNSIRKQKKETGRVDLD